MNIKLYTSTHLSEELIREKLWIIPCISIICANRLVIDKAILMRVVSHTYVTFSRRYSIAADKCILSDALVEFPSIIISQHRSGETPLFEDTRLIACQDNSKCSFSLFFF